MFFFFPENQSAKEKRRKEGEIEDRCKFHPFSFPPPLDKCEIACVANISLPLPGKAARHYTSPEVPPSMDTSRVRALGGSTD